jgi:CelD/BcsL family acetyltransferase involved in cellulose biosynthesis
VPGGAAQVVELGGDDRCLAEAIVFTHRRTRYLYNMSYDLSLAAASPTGIAPGVVLVSHLAEQALNSGFEFDFLKGAQEYKLRLGGAPEDTPAIELNR